MGELIRDLKRELREEILQGMSYERQMTDEELAQVIDGKILEQMEREPMALRDRLRLQKELFDSFRRLDILQELVDDPGITEIMVNGPEEVFVETEGRIRRWEKSFESREQLLELIRQIVSRVNRTVNTASPIVDARLEDGSRVHVVLEPVALNGPILTIRKFPDPITMDRLLEYGSVTREAADLLKTLAAARYNIFVSGGTGAGKTTFLNALSEFIPPEERVITIEDSAELKLAHIENLVRLETRNANGEGQGAIGIGMLIRAALRMRPEGIKIKKGKLERKKKRIPIPHTFLQHILGNLIPFIRCEVVKIIEEADNLLSFFHSVLHVEGILPIHGICTQHSFPE